MSGKRAKQLRAVEKATTDPPKQRFRKLGGHLLVFAFVAALACGVSLLALSKSTSTMPSASAVLQAHSLELLLAMTPEELARVDIAEMNLLCATGLPGSEDLNIDECLAKLDKWAARVKHETERHLYRLTDPRYKDHAEHYKHSEARFRAEWLVSVL